MNLKEEDFKLFERKVNDSKNEVSYKKLIEFCREITGDTIGKEYEKLQRDASSRDKLSQSEMFRKLGNDVLNLQKYQKSVEFYTRSIAWAPKGSSARGQAYANRSAVLEMMGNYEECVRDVDKALDNDYPQMLRFKLYIRQAQCFRELKQAKKATQALEKAKSCIAELKLQEDKKKQLLDSVDKEFSVASEPKAKKINGSYPEPPIVSYGKNQEAPSFSSAVAISHSDDFGRHLVAAKDIQAGDVLLVEQPYAAVLAPESIYTHCNHCMKQCNNLVPCENCDWVLYCSLECEKTAYERYHKEECPVSVNCFKVIDEMNLQRSCHFVRIVSTFGLKNVRNFLNKNPEETPDSRTKGFDKSGTYSSDSFESIYDLVTNVQELPPLMIFAACTIAIKLAKCFELKDSKFESQIAAFCLKNLIALKNNAHEITHTHLTGTSRVRYEVIGGGIFACASLSNHSCNPNVFRTNYGTANVIQAIRHIKKGDQIFDSYKVHFAFDPKEERQNYLMDHYHFKCTCEACDSDWGQVQTLPIHPKFNFTKDKKIKSLYEQMIIATFSCSDNALPITDGNFSTFIRVINTLSHNGSKSVLTQTMQGAQEDLKNFFKSKGNCLT